MACCHDRRARLTQGLRAAQSAPSPAPPTGAQTTVRYVGPVPMVLRGTASGQVYRLSEADGLTEVDSRDATALLRTSWFRRA